MKKGERSLDDSKIVELYLCRNETAIQETELPQFVRTEQE